MEEALERVETPSLKPRSLIGSFGPGLILMMTGIGTSHLVTAPAAGGRFGYALLWCIPLAYIFKYSGFEMAFRFTHATGHSLLDAYATAPRSWPLIYVLVTTLVQCVVGQAGRLVAAAAVLYYAISALFGVEVPLAWLALSLGVVSVAVHLGGRYSIMETVTKILAGVLVVSGLGIYVLEPAPGSALRHFFIPDIPDGSWLILAAFLGLLPTGIDVSLQASEWGKARKVGLGYLRPAVESDGLAPRFEARTSPKQALAVDHSRLPAGAREYCRRWLTIALWDFRIGHFISFLLACLFLLLAAVHLYPSDVSGNAVMGEIGGIFTEAAGPWMMAVFLLGAFAATFSTAFNYFDGWPRVVGACCRGLFSSTASMPGLDRAEISPESRRNWAS
ncbi:MAG: Nramp family divalent metal transporter [Acidobacteriota bacterium]|nr:Nramp family divalent metal transporter [Acidobacteriota bacterium]